MRAALALLLAALLGFAAPAWADPQIGGKRVALVIGNSGYRNVDRLPNSGNDARLIAGTLQELGFSLVGGGVRLDLDRAHLTQAVQDFGHALAGAEVGLFYYSGHGLQVQGVNWLVPVDANPSRPQDLDFQMVDADLVLRQMDGAGTKLNLVLLDACRNNPFAVRGLRALQGGLAEMRAPEGTLISYATQPGNVAADGTGPNSPYSAALASNMRQPDLDIFRMFNRVGLQVKRSTGGSQQPWVSTSPIDGDFYFSRAEAPAQVAGLARPPEPVPTAASADPGSRLVASARALRCSVLDTRTVGNRVEVGGLALPGRAWDEFLKQVEGNRSVRVASAIDFLPPFACEAVDALGAAVQKTRGSEGGRLLTLSRREIAAGDKLVVTLRGAAGKTVSLDLLQPGGTVQHLLAPPTAEAGGARVFAVQPAMSAPGPRLLIALVSAAPLELGTRPQIEPASAYVAALRQALLSAADMRADMAPFGIRPTAVPVRAAAKTPVRPPRCSTILERAQLGEALSDLDRAYLRAQCP